MLATATALTLGYSCASASTSHLTRTLSGCCTDYTDRTDYGFILALFCMVLALVVAIAIFKPAPVRGEMISAMTVGL